MNAFSAHSVPTSVSTPLLSSAKITGVALKRAKFERSKGDNRGQRSIMKSCLLGVSVFADLLRFLILGLRSKSSLAAENLFLRKQLAIYQERGPGRTSKSARLTLLWLSRWFDWREALTVVTPRAFIGWHRLGFQFYWRRKCQVGRPPIPPELQALIRRMAHENPSWGEERIANELLLKLGLRVSPRTIRKYFTKYHPLPPGSGAAISDGPPF
jgi:putative transposase